MDNYWLPYLVIMAHFVSGSIWLMMINKKADPEEAREQWKKYLVYLFLFNLLWFSITWSESLFPILGYVILAGCTVEWWKAVGRSGSKFWPTLVFILIMAGFWRFLYMEKADLLFTYFVVVLFDGASQITGQLKGRRALVPKISPAKTVEGLVGGTLVTLATVLLVHNAFSYDPVRLVLLTFLLMTGALAGDLMASAVKRKKGLHRFSNVLPGHGGVLDRYDSLVMAASMMYLFSLMGN